MMLQSFATAIFMISAAIQASGVTVPITDALVHGLVTINVGAGNYMLIVDSGSANTWVGAKTPYQPGPNSKDTGETVTVHYGSGNFSGKVFLDNVDLSSELVVSGQSIGVAKTSTGFNDVDGVLGLGPSDLSSGTTSGGGVVPTVTENLFTEGAINSNLVAISLEPSTSTHEGEIIGEISFGEVDSSKYTGDINYTPITLTSPASTFWGLDASFQYGASRANVLSTTAGIIDHTTSLLLLATDAFKDFQKLTGATPDTNTGLLKVPSTETLESLFFQVKEVTYEITANALIWPRALNSIIGGEAAGIYLVVGDHGSPSGSGLDFVIGYSILRRFYTVLDTGNHRIGIATTPHTHDTTN
ncbi:hypothetical protein BGZ99_008359 [Dissophora globulifera]|uniref:Peptidase A1 domain-containing protein n=1 Tax=Dissophora globulifera TaxID=979702 RepID=A0A9P6R7I1_9FUNG|nr:hypothetical protein BGZ99_008359 [Dissophora globulifera]